MSTIDINSNYLLSSMYSFYKNKRVIINGVINTLHLKNPKSPSLDKKNIKFNINLSSFLDYLKVFSEIFYNHYYHLNCLILEFKNKNIEIKEVYADLISEKYKDFISEILKTAVPRFIEPSMKIFLNALEKRKIYYSLYNDYTNNNDILEMLENEAIALEKKFWNRFNRINNYFKNKVLNKQY
ncbi:MAG: hypothetical protein FJW68_02185 [Actinobacteria bacterium]|nr:hypothetical protein [Actinomycetota bacterium]